MAGALTRYTHAMWLLFSVACSPNTSGADLGDSGQQSGPTSDADSGASADETAKLETAQIDTGNADSAGDTATPDTATPDTAMPDTAMPDTAETDTGPADSGSHPLPVDFRDAGPEPFSTSEATFTASSGCALDYYLATPTTGFSTLVVLLHGLERANEQQRLAADHLASYGVAVVAPTSCQASVLDLDQAQNGLDAIELAHSLTSGPILYAGHSAGGLAAFYAASQDATALAFFGLDPTEWNNIATNAASQVTVPTFAAIGSSGVCNVDNNFVPILESLGGRALRITEADHCDFENPTDWVCTLACGTESNDQFSDDEIYATALGLMASFVAWQAGIEPSGESWWIAGGDGYDALLAEGATSEP